MPQTIDRPVVVLLRLEGVAACAVGLAGYLALSDSWLMFALFALAPDLAMLGYVLGPKVGARLYNVAHTYVVPVSLAALGIWAVPEILPIACVWLVHIGVDRALGYGLKSETAFGLTHLGPVGRRA
ncbi:DUF4260 domain-containing protein [Celeribacter sp.]|uniref:DUF4260 domain-containing protein n=1 Tax=Celeribacter sp. TaxID=1890673 RepID=UPI003A8EF16B